MVGLTSLQHLDNGVPNLRSKGSFTNLHLFSEALGDVMVRMNSRSTLMVLKTSSWQKLEGWTVHKR